MRKATLAVAAFLALTGTASAQKADIEKANAKWIELFNKGDYAGVATLYTKDAVVLPADAAMVKGRDAISALWKDVGAKVTHPALKTIEVKRLAPRAAREIGAFKLQTKGPNPQELSGKYVVIWEKENGAWKLSTDIWNAGQ
jgi:uncharacterized protein (TIGR02246 family)